MMLSWSPVVVPPAVLDDWHATPPRRTTTSEPANRGRRMNPILAGRRPQKRPAPTESTIASGPSLVVSTKIAAVLRMVNRCG